MKQVLSVVSGCLVTLAAVAADSSASRVFQMRLVADKPSSETEQMTLVEKRHAREHTEVLSIQKTALLDQTDLKSATVSTNTPTGAPVIEIAFTDKGAKRFAKVTRQNIGKRLAIIIDGQVYWAPTLQTEITAGRGQISGSFSEQEARDLAAKISKTLQK
jgi:SecD/SecF fusion protein